MPRIGNPGSAAAPSGIILHHNHRPDGPVILPLTRVVIGRSREIRANNDGQAIRVSSLFGKLPNQIDGLIQIRQ